MRGYANILMRLNRCFFSIKYNELIKEYNEIWDKVSNSIQKRVYSKSVHNEKYLKSKTKSYEGKFNKTFYDDGNPKEV